MWNTVPAKAGAVFRRSLHRFRGRADAIRRPRRPINTAAPADLRRAIPRPSERTLLRVSGWTMVAVAALVVGFLLHLLVISWYAESRSQGMLYAKFRSQLSLGTAPIGQVDARGKLLTMGDPVAIISIPALGITDTVVEGTTSRALLAGPGHRRDTPLPGQQGISVIYGRQSAYGGPFRGLKELRAGDKITSMTGQGKATYTVLGLRRAGDTAPPIASPKDGRLTLVFSTGAPFMSNDVVRVDAKLDGTAQPTPQPVLLPGSLTKAEDPLASDPSGWLPMFLLVELAILAVAAIILALRRWGRWHTWIVGLPVVLVLGVEIAKQAVVVLPNLY